MKEMHRHTLWLLFSAHWGGPFQSKCQGSLEIRTGHRDNQASPCWAQLHQSPGLEAMFGAPLFSAVLWEKDDQQHNEEDKETAGHCQPQVDLATLVLPAFLLGQVLGCLSEGRATVSRS